MRFVFLIKKQKIYSFMLQIKYFKLVLKSDLEAFIELKNRSEYFDEFILDYNRFLNNYTIYSFPINRYSRNDKHNKYININRNWY